MKKFLFFIAVLFSAGLLHAQTVVFHENFDAPSYSDSAAASGAANNFALNSRLFHSGTRCDSTLVTPNDTAFLTTNSFNTTGLGYVFLNFSHICKIEYLDGGEVFVSVGGGPWVKLTGTEYVNPGNSQFVTNANRFNSNTYTSDWLATQALAKPQQSWWKNETFNISAIAGNQSDVRIRFSLRDGNANGAGFNHGWYIDDIKITGAISELTPPTIDLVPPIVQDTVFNTGPFDIYAWIKDASGIDTAYLIYQVNGGANLYIPMIWISDTTYKCTIPSYTYGTNIDYQIHAIDNSVSHNAITNLSTWFIVKRPPNIVQVGTGTNIGTYPFYENFGYSRSASIYLGTEINMSGVINSLQWDVSSAVATNCPVKIYLKSTASSSFSTGSTWANLIAGATLVYSGTTNFGTIGWQTFTLSPPFGYSTGNLMVLCEANYGGSGTSPYANFHYTPTSGTTHQYIQQDNSPPTNAGDIDNSRPNIKIGFPASSNHPDAGVKQILTPTGTIIAGVNTPVTLQIKNYSIDSLKKASIAWKLDGVLKSPYPWIGPIGDGMTSATINIGDVNVGLGSHTLRAWTELPNDSVDYNHYNDTCTISFYACSALLSGNYTIGGGGADFPTFADAMTALNNCGVGGPTIFHINSGTYNLQLTFNEIPGATATNTITFKPNSGSHVTIIDSSSSTITFNGGDYIILDGSDNFTNSHNMTITNASTSASSVISMVSAGPSLGCQYNTIKNCNIVGASNTLGYGISIGGASIGLGGDDNDNITLQNNNISNAYVGIWAGGSMDTNPGLMDSLRIIGNSIGSTNAGQYIGHDGIMVGKGSGCKIEKNTVYNIITTNTTPVGITLSAGFVSSTVSKNNINNIKYSGSSGYGGRGMYVNTESSTSNLIIANNIIYQVGGDGYSGFSNSSPVGMYFDGTMDGLNIYYNSVYMSGDLTYSSSTKTTAILFNSGSIAGINLKNNVFQNSMNNITSSGSTNYAIYSEAPASSFTSINYNDYYVTGTQGMLGYMGADVATIGAWKTATAQDINSISANPNFIGVNNLRSYSSNLNGQGTPVPTVLDDMDGTIRSTTTPDIGAYEFDYAAKNLGIIAITQPVSSCSLTANEHITIRLKNYGYMQIDTAQLYYKVDNGTLVHQQMIHTIQPDSSYDFTFSVTSNFSVPANYNIKSYIHVAGDITYLNDTINNYSINSGIDLSLSAYTMGFEPSDDMSLWTKDDVTADNYSWNFPYNNSFSAHTGNNSAELYTGGSTGDDWLFSRCFRLNSGSAYKIEFWYEASYSGSPQNIDLVVGTDNTPAAMTTTLLTLSSFSNTIYQKATVSFVPTVTGSYYFGWWGHSSSSYSNAYVDDINISILPPQEATLVEITSPSTGCGLSSAEHVIIKIMNSGSDIINGSGNLTAYYKINNGAVVSAPVNNVINVGNTLSFTFPQTYDFHVTTTDATFNLKSWVSLVGDPYQFNDSITKSIVSQHTPPPPVTFNTSVVYGATATIHAIAVDYINWYDVPTGGASLATATSYTTPYLYNTTIFYADAMPILPNQIVIDGNGTLDQSNIPTYGDNQYGWSGAIYDASELGFSGTIDTLFYYVNNVISAFTMANQSIYMANTPLSVFPNANKPGPAGLTQVYSGTISWSGPGWQKIGLQTPFLLNNGQNLMIYYENNSGVSGWPNPTFAATATSGNKGVYASNYSSLPPTGNTTGDRANIKLNYSAHGCSSIRVPDTVFVTGVPPCDLSVQAIHTPNSGIELTNDEIIKIRIKNYGTASASNIPVSYRINNGTPVTEIIATSIPSNDTLEYAFNAHADLSNMMTYNIKVYTGLTCDVTHLNDTLLKTVINNPIPYCFSGATNTGDEEIFSVTLNGATNAYNCSTVAPGPNSLLNQYSNFTTLPPLTTLSMGVPTSFTILEDECDGSTYYFNGIAIWIDLNHDGDFTDAGEQVFVEDTVTKSPRTVTGTITVPPGSYAGVTTMRITCAENLFGSDLLPCMTYGYGETEDYRIKIAPPIPHDAGISSFTQPTLIQNAGVSVPVQMVINNYGLDSIKNSSNMTVAYSYNGGSLQTLLWTGGNIAPLASATITLPNLTVLVGTHSLCGWTVLSGDSNTFNDTTCVSLIGKMPIDAGIEIISKPVPYAIPGSHQIVKVVIHNFGTTSLNSIPISYKSNNGTPTTETWTGVLAPDDTTSFPFTALLLIPSGPFELCAYTGLTSDGDHQNDTICKSVLGIPTFHVPYSDNLEGPVNFYTPGNLWEWGVPSALTINAAYSPTHAWATNLNGYYTNNAEEYMLTPFFNFSIVDSAYLDFYHWYDTQSGSDGGNIQYTINGGTTWLTLGSQSDPAGQNWYNATLSGTPCWSGSSSGYVHSRFRLPNSIINASGKVQFRFHFFSNSSGSNNDGWAVDNFAITAPPIPKDAGVIAIWRPNAATQTGASVIVKAIVKNFGTNILTSIPVGYNIDGGAVTNQTWTGNLMPGDTVTVSFVNTYPSPGTPYELCAFTLLSGDSYWFNDSTCSNFGVTPGTHDVGVTKILNPGVNTVAGQADTVKVTIKNFGLNSESNFQVVYLRNGFQLGAGYFTGTLSPGDTAVYKFSAPILALMGPYNLCAKTQLVGDVWAPNDNFCIYPTGTVGIENYDYSSFELLQNQPNPSSNQTSIVFLLPAADKVNFEMVDILGHSIMNKDVAAVAGKNQIDLDVASIAEGVYFYSVKYKDQKLTKRMIITK